MIHLILNILFASTFMLSIKWVQVRQREDVVCVGAINYIVAALWVLPEFLRSANDLDVDSSSLVAAITTGVTMGSCYFVAYFFVIYTIKKVGAASSSVVGVLSILVPILCGIAIWNEKPNGLQLVGVLFAFVSLLLIGWKKGSAKDEKRRWFTPFILMCFFVLAGLSRLSQEAFKHVSEPDYRPTFLFAAFLVAAIPSLAILIYRRKWPSWRELGLGFAMGASNILQSHFILKALQSFDGFVVFPVTSAGALVLTTVVANQVLGEKLNRRTVAGIAIAVVALVMLNWLPTES